MKTILTTIYAGIFYILWVPAATLKDLIGVLYTPVDTQRFANTFVAFNRNLKNLTTFLDNVPDQEESTDTEQPKREPIGFRTFAKIDCQNPSEPENPESPE